MNSYISKYFQENKFGTILHTTALKHIAAFLTAMVMRGYRGKMVDVAASCGTHRTTLSYFLSHGQWDDGAISTFIKTDTFARVQQRAEETNEPMFVIVDDTMNPKSKPEPEAMRPIEDSEWHYSHLERKQVWGHQVVAVMVSCGGMDLNYDVHLYDKKTESKIKYIEELAKSMPEAQTKSYAMGDSWYTCASIIKAFRGRGYYYIGAMKTNRVIYPHDTKINIYDFVEKALRKPMCDLVTVKGHQYYAYRYEGKINGVDGNAAVIITLPADKGFVGEKANPKLANAFVCTDTLLSTTTILEFYPHRWCIETFFQEVKGQQGFSQYQIRSIEGIKRLWLLISLCHLLCSTGLGITTPFADGRRFLRDSISKERFAFFYKCAQNDVPIEVLYDLVA